LAVITAAFSGKAAVSFNAPGVMDSCLAISTMGLAKGVQGLFEMINRCVVNQRVQNIKIGGDPVSEKLITGRQPGTTKVITAAGCGINPLCLHSMSTIVKNMMSDRQYHVPLSL
jgi:tetrahydromethanopterin S-methyltransferase subunit D